MSLNILNALLAVTALWAITRLVQGRQKRSKLPPGPPGWPIIGSILAWPTRQRWLTFTEWGRTYGDIVYVNLAGSDVIILNSLTAATTLLETKGANFSDRPSLRFGCEIVGWKDLPGLMNLGPTLNEHRKRILQVIGSKQMVDNLEGTIREEVLKCLNSVMEDPWRLGWYIRMFNTSVTLSVAYGYKVEREDDQFVVLAEKVLADLASVVVPGAFLVDMIPALKYIPAWAPGGRFKQIAAAMIKDRERFLNEPYEFTINELAAGRAQPSYIAKYVSAGDLSQEEAQLIKWEAVNLYVGGSDTTVSGMKTFVLCMLLNPAVQQRAQAEIDSVVGHDRLPTLADQGNLPYLNACLKESNRWAPVTPEALPHRARADDEYNGFFIPAGTTMIPNVWGIAHNPAIYSDPFAFRPERFLGPSPEPEPDFTFGFGRRFCPGQLLAQTSAYIFVAHLLALFDTIPGRGPDGAPMEVKVEYDGQGSIVFPSDFPFKCTPRSEKAKALFVDALES